MVAIRREGRGRVGVRGGCGGSDREGRGRVSMREQGVM